MELTSPLLGLWEMQVIAKTHGRHQPIQNINTPKEYLLGYWAFFLSSIVLMFLICI